MTETYYSDAGMTLYHGDVLSELKQMPDESVQCVVTSPPYWGLRDYGTATWVGGDAECDHMESSAFVNPKNTLGPNGHLPATNAANQMHQRQYKNICGKCGAQREDKQLGLEPTPDAYVANMVAVFAEVRRVLRSDGTCWLNLGDTMLPNKCEAMIPHRVAMALMKDGWICRSTIIWSKPNPMPESVTDRPTKSHEYLFLLAKGEWKSRIVQFSNLPSERFHFFEHFRPYGHPVSSATRVPVDLATAILDSSQLEHDVSLPPFYAEVWQQLPDGSDSDFVRGLPIEHRPAVWAARFLASHCTAEEFFCEIDRLRIAHSDGNHLLECWNFSSTVVDAPSISSDGEGTITIHYPGEICKIEFPFHRLIISRPSRCSYYYDADAVREPHARLWDESNGGSLAGGDRLTKAGRNDGGRTALPDPNPAGRNKRSVWTVATQPYSEAHFATFPPKLIEPCILAGTSEKGACPACGAPWMRVVERTTATPGQRPGYTAGPGTLRNDGERAGSFTDHTATTTGWQPSCTCDAGDPVPCVVLDPFMGSGTTAMVAQKHGRKALGIDISATYLDLAIKRNAQKTLWFTEAAS